MVTSSARDQFGTVGILGAGAVGLALAGHLTRVGIDVVLCNRQQPEQWRAAIDRLGALARAGTLQDVVSREIVIAAVPWDALAETLSQVADWEARVLIDATNPPLGNGIRHVELAGRPSSEIVSSLAPGAHVVKAFNTLPSSLLAQSPVVGPRRRVLFYSSNHEPARKLVGRLIRAMGFAGVELGSLSTGGRLQDVPGGPLALLNLLQISS